MDGDVTYLYPLSIQTGCWLHTSYLISRAVENSKDGFFLIRAILDEYLLKERLKIKFATCMSISVELIPKSGTFRSKDM